MRIRTLADKPQSLPEQQILLSLQWGLIVASLLLAGLWLSTKVLIDTAKADAKRPNILLLLADDLGVNDVGAYQKDWGTSQRVNTHEAKTPHIDALAVAGTRFTRHYAEATCSPSRASLLTGMYAQRSGFTPVGAMIPDDFITLPELLKSRGYNTHAVGKWHVGTELRGGWPLQKGFDSWLGFLNQWQLPQNVPHNHDVLLRPSYNNPWLRRDNKPPQQYQGHLTDILLEESRRFIRKQKHNSEPWLLYHAFFAPHTPIEPHPRVAVQFDDSPAGRYRALVHQMDAAIGAIVDELKATGQYDNTLIIFMSDNGGTNITMDNNFPFYGAKDEVYEGSYRTPLIVSWPQQHPQAQVFTDTVMNVDILPTLAELTNAPLPYRSDGESLLSVIKGSLSVLPTRSRLWQVYHWGLDSFSASLFRGRDNQRITARFGVYDKAFDLQADSNGQEDVYAQHPAWREDFRREFWTTHNRLSLLAKHDLSNQEKPFELTTHAAQRTPGLGGFSLGLGVGPATNSIAEGEILLAKQDKLWQLSVSTDNKLRWRISDKVLEFKGFDLGRCNNIVLSGYDVPAFHAHLGESVLKLFVNGSLADSQEYSGDLLANEQQINQATVFFTGNNINFGTIQLRNVVSTSSDEIYEPELQDQVFKARLLRDRRSGEQIYPALDEQFFSLCPASGSAS